jgi:cysteinyl-tRNA synthetase
MKLAMLSAHYRQPINWTRQGAAEAKRTLDHWYELTADAPDGAPLCADVLEALADDLNTPQAIAELHKGSDLELAGGLGLLGFSNTQIRIEAKKEVDTVAIADAIVARNAARQAKNFKESDRIRDELAAKGILLKDGPSGTTWEVKR